MRFKLSEDSLYTMSYLQSNTLPGLCVESFQSFLSFCSFRFRNFRRFENRLRLRSDSRKSFQVKSKFRVFFCRNYLVWRCHHIAKVERFLFERVLDWHICQVILFSESPCKTYSWYFTLYWPRAPKWPNRTRKSNFSSSYLSSLEITKSQNHPTWLSFLRESFSLL